MRDRHIFNDFDPQVLFLDWVKVTISNSLTDEPGAFGSIEGVDETRRVAVIIPFFNGSKFIERAILSAVAQTVRPFEIIVVDDGSSAEEQEFLVGLNKKYPFKIIIQTNGGQGAARNKGVASSVSELICFLDQDDFFLDYHIELLMTAIGKRDKYFGYVYADLKIADVNGMICSNSALRDYSSPHPKTRLTDLLRNDMYILPSASLICRRAFQAVGGFDPQFTGYEDDDLFLRMFRSGFEGVFLDKPVTVWCVHSNSTSYSIKMSKSRWKYFVKLMTLFPDDPSRGLYYMRDCMMPRFEPSILDDVFNPKAVGRDNRAEVLSIFRGYVAAVAANPSVGSRHKARLKLIDFGISYLPGPVISYIRRSLVVRVLIRLIVR